MAINWKQLRYGTLVASGAIITGTTIYVSTRINVQSIDVQELTEGLQERARAIQYASATTLNISTLTVRHFTNISTTYAVPNGTNPPTMVPFLEDAGTTDLVVTNTALAFVYSTTETMNTGKIIWAGWSNLTASGFSDSSINNTYVLAGYADHTNVPVTTIGSLFGHIGYYTNSAVAATAGSTNWVLLDVRNKDRKVVDGDPSWHYEKADTWRIQNLFVTFSTQVLANTVVTNIDPVWEWDYPTGVIGLIFSGLKRYYADGWNTFKGTTNWYREQTYPSPAGEVTAVDASLDTNEIRAATVYFSEVRQNVLPMQTPDTNWWNAFDVAITSLVPSFVDYWHMTNGPVYHTATGLFDRLDIGDGTNRFTSYVTSGIPIYGGVGFRLHETNLIERYKILHALTTVVGQASALETVVSNAVSNVVYTTIDNFHFVSSQPYNSNDTPEPFVDAWITNASGDFIPEGWVPLRIDPWLPQTTFGHQFFYTNWFPSRTFDGSFVGAVSTNVDASVPRWEYAWQFHFELDSFLRFDTNLSSRGNFDIFDGYQRYHHPLIPSIDTSHTAIAHSDVGVVINADLTGVVVNADYYGKWYDRTNFDSSAYTWTGVQWRTLGSSTGQMEFVSHTNSLSNYSVGIPSILSSNVYGRWSTNALGQTNGQGFQSGPSATDPANRHGPIENPFLNISFSGRARTHISHTGTSLLFFGRKLGIATGVLHFTFTRCKDPL
jgi:hypothetical protein